MGKGLAIILGFLPWILIFSVFFWAGKNNTIGKKNQFLIHRLFKNKLITKEQVEQIEAFEKEQKIKAWEKAGILSKEQAQDILYPQAKKQWFSFVTSLLYLGVGCIVIGIVALIAANYDKIPPVVRLTSVLIFLTVCSSLVYLFWQKQKTVFMDLCSVACIGLLGAAIGLVSQTFHLDGRAENAIFLWSILSLPYVLLSTKPYLSFVWYPFFFISFFTTEYGRKVLEFFAKNFQISTAFISFFFIGICVYMLLQKYATKKPFTQAFRLWGMLLSVCIVVMVDSFFSSKSIDFVPKLIVPSFSLLLISCIYPIYATMLYRKQFELRLLMFVAFFGLITTIAPLPIFGIIFTLTILSFAAVYFARKNLLRTFNWAILAMAGRILFAYFYLFMSLAKTGISAIILGILILTGLYVWSKKRNSLIQFLQKGK